MTGKDPIEIDCPEQLSRFHIFPTGALDICAFRDDTSGRIRWPYTSGAGLPIPHWRLPDVKVPPCCHPEPTA